MKRFINLVLIIILLTFHSCQRNKFNTFLSAYDENNEMIINGEYSERNVKGKWIYLLGDKEFSFNWHQDSINDIKFSYPMEWENVKDSSFIFLNRYGTFNGDTAQIVCSYSGSSNRQNFETYYTNWKSKLIHKDSLIDLQAERLIENAIFLRYKNVTKTGKEINRMCLITKSNGSIFDLSYVYLGNNLNLHKIIFFNFIIGMKSKVNSLVGIHDATTLLDTEISSYELIDEIVSN